MNIEILEITKNFHDMYEKLASEYNYETREDTKVFDINSNNGKLMYATVNEIVSPILKENKQLKMIVNEYEKLNKGFKITNVQEYNIDELLSYKKYKDNWTKLKEYINEANKDLYWTNNYDDILCVMQELEQSGE